MTRWEEIHITKIKSQILKSFKIQNTKDVRTVYRINGLKNGKEHVKKETIPHKYKCDSPYMLGGGRIIHYTYTDYISEFKLQSSDHYNSKPEFCDPCSMATNSDNSKSNLINSRPDIGPTHGQGRRKGLAEVPRDFLPAAVHPGGQLRYPFRKVKLEGDLNWLKWILWRDIRRELSLLFHLPLGETFHKFKILKTCFQEYFNELLQEEVYLISITEKIFFFCINMIKNENFSLIR